MNVSKHVVKYALLVLSLVPALVWAGEAGKAQIITSAEKPAECIAAVHVNRIDDREVKVQKLGFEIEPGVHTLSARALIDTSLCKAVGIGTGMEKVGPLEVNLEAGKTYYLGYDHSAPHRRDWKLVIWKVEDGNANES